MLRAAAPPVFTQPISVTAGQPIARLQALEKLDPQLHFVRRHTAQDGVRALTHRLRRGDPDDNNRLVLGTRVTSKSSYKLTVADETQARGFVQKININALDIARRAGKHALALSMTRTPGVFNRVGNSLAAAHTARRPVNCRHGTARRLYILHPR